MALSVSSTTICSGGTFTASSALRNVATMSPRKNWAGETLTDTVRSVSPAVRHSSSWAERRPDDPASDLDDQARFLGNRDHLRRRDKLAAIAPAQQRLAASDAATPEVDHRLEVQFEVALIEAGPESLLDRQPLVDGGGQRRRGEGGTIAASALRVVHRDVSVAQQLVRGHAVIREDGDAHAGGDLHGAPAQVVHRAHPLQQSLRSEGGRPRIYRASDSSARTRRHRSVRTRPPHAAPSPLAPRPSAAARPRLGAQASRLIQLEPIEVHEEDGERVISTLCALDGVVRAARRTRCGC